MATGFERKPDKFLTTALQSAQFRGVVQSQDRLRCRDFEAHMPERLDRNGSALNAEVPLHSKLVNVLSGPGEMHTLTAPSQRSARGRLFLV